MAQDCHSLVTLNAVLIDPEGDLSSGEFTSSLHSAKLLTGENCVCESDSFMVEKHANCFSLSMQPEVNKSGWV